MINARGYAQRGRDLLDGLVALLRVEQNQVFDHEYTHNVLGIVFIDRDPAEASGVDLGEQLSAQDCVDFQHIGLLHFRHDVFDRLILQL